MRGLDRSSICKKVAYLVLLAIVAVAATPLPATESELKAKPSEASKPEAEARSEAAVENSPAEAASEPSTGTCLDPDAAENAGVNTLEDIFSAANGNVAVLLNLNDEPIQAKKPAVEEVRWTEVEKQKQTETEKEQAKAD